MIRFTTYTCILACVLAFMGCRSLEVELNEKPPHRRPMQTDRGRMQEDLRAFGLMLQAYNCEERIFNVDAIPNASGRTKDLPKDLYQQVAMTLSQIGRPIYQRRMHPSTLQNDPIYGSQQLVGDPALTFRPQDGQTTADRYVTVAGALISATPRARQSWDIRGDASPRIGQEDIDLEAGGDAGAEIVDYRVTLELVNPNNRNVAEFGPASVFDVRTYSDEYGFFAGFYLNNSGIGASFKREFLPDAESAMSEAIAAAMIQCVGNYYVIPYYRCSSIFAVTDSVQFWVNDVKRRQIEEMSIREVHAELVLYLFLHGDAFSDEELLSEDLLPSARKKIARTMDRNNLYIEVDKDCRLYLFHLWQTVPIEEAARRMREFTIRRQRLSASLQEEQASVGSQNQVEIPKNEILLDMSVFPDNYLLLMQSISKMPDVQSVVVDQADERRCFVRLDAGQANPRITLERILRQGWHYYLELVAVDQNERHLRLHIPTAIPQN